MEYFFTLDTLLPYGVGFSHFSPAHLGWLAFSLCLVLLICRGYKHSRKRRAFRISLGCAILACEIAKDACLIIQGAFSIYYLPLHLCGLAVFFTFYHALRPSNTVGNFLYSTCMPGAAFALLFPDWIAYPPLSFHSIVAFTVHALIVAYPIALAYGGDIRLSPRFLPRCGIILLVLGIFITAFDVAFNANYMFLIVPAPGSPLDWFASFMGRPWYVLSYIPMIAAIWLVLYLPIRKPIK